MKPLADEVSSMFRRLLVVAAVVVALIAVAPSAGAEVGRSVVGTSTNVNQAETEVQVASMAYGTTYFYPIYHYQVCQRQGHFGASYYNGYSPYSWYCYDLSIPFGITFAGGLDINGWCQATYRGSHAELVSNDAWGWKCVRRA